MKDKIITSTLLIITFTSQQLAWPYPGCAPGVQNGLRPLATGEGQKKEKQVEERENVVIQNPDGIHMLTSANIKMLGRYIESELGIEVLVFKDLTTVGISIVSGGSTPFSDLFMANIKNGDMVKVRAQGIVEKGLLIKILDLIEDLFKDPATLEKSPDQKESHYGEYVQRINNLRDEFKPEVAPEIKLRHERDQLAHEIHILTGLLLQDPEALKRNEGMIHKQMDKMARLYLRIKELENSMVEGIRSVSQGAISEIEGSI